MTDRPPLRMQIKLNATPERIFAALTDSEALETWFVEHADIDPDANRYDFWGKFTPEAPDKESGQHRLLAYEPNRSLKFAWNWSDQETEVSFTLHPRGDQTILAVEQDRGQPGKHQIDSYTMEDFWFLSLENLRRYLDGKPCDIRATFPIPETGNIEFAINIDAEPERVFDVLTNPEEVERWIASDAEIDLQPGGKYLLGWEGMESMKIVELEDNQKLAITMVGMDGESGTVVTWTLEGSGGKTRLTLVHSGFGLDEKTEGLQAGWRNFMGWVRSVAEYGPAWEPALVPLQPEATIYPRIMMDLQSELVW